MKKYLVLGFIILFVGASVLPSISGNIQSTNTFSNGSGIILSVNRANEVESEANPVEPLDLVNSFFDIYEVTDFGQTAWGTTSADFNDDGDIDFAVSSATAPFTQSTISIFYNEGDLVFTRDDVYIFDYSYISDLDSGDYDLDGNIDLMFTYSENKGSSGGKTNGTVNLLLNDGANNFDNHIMIAKHVGNKRFNPHITSADFDMDGDLDFLVGDNSGNVEIYLNNGSGNFTSSGIIDDWGGLSWGLTSADFDGDGDIDFLVAAEDWDLHLSFIYLKRNQLIESNYTIIFEPGLGELISELPWMQRAASLISLDYNNDGAMDFIAGVGAEPYLYINRNGSFEQFFICMLPPSPEGYVEDLKEGGMTSADYDNDGYTDLVTGGDQGTVRLLINKHSLAVITRPIDGLGIYYLFDKINYLPIPFENVLITGKFTVVVKELVELEKVEFYVDRRLQETVTAPPYNFSWTWKPVLLFKIRHTIKIVAYDSDGNHSSEDEKKVWRIL